MSPSSPSLSSPSDEPPLGCDECRAAARSPEKPPAPLRSAAGYGPLRGSRLVGSRGIRDLLVCRSCEALWWSFEVPREGYRGLRPLGSVALRVFAADTDLARVVDWIATDYRDEIFRPAHELATLVVRRRPQDLQTGADALFVRLSALTPPAGDRQGERLAELCRVLGLVVERAVRGDLRPPGPRPTPPARWHPEELRAARERFEEHVVDGLARLPCTTDVLRRLLWEQRFGPGAPSAKAAVIAVAEPEPILQLLAEPPFEAVPDGTRRGVFAAAAFEAGRALHAEGRRPEHDHALWMPAASWQRLARLVEPVHRLAGTVRRLVSALESKPADLPARIAMETVLVREPLRLGARLTDSARSRLVVLGARLGTSPAGEALREILAAEHVGREADSRSSIR